MKLAWIFGGILTVSSSFIAVVVADPPPSAGLRGTSTTNHMQYLNKRHRNILGPNAHSVEVILENPADPSFPGTTTTTTTTNPTQTTRIGRIAIVLVLAFVIAGLIRYCIVRRRRRHQHYLKRIMKDDGGDDDVWLESQQNPTPEFCSENSAGSSCVEGESPNIIERNSHGSVSSSATEGESGNVSVRKELIPIPSQGLPPVV